VIYFQRATIKYIKSSAGEQVWISDFGNFRRLAVDVVQVEFPVRLTFEPAADEADDRA